MDNSNQLNKRKKELEEIIKNSLFIQTNLPSWIITKEQKEAVYFLPPFNEPLNWSEWNDPYKRQERLKNSKTIDKGVWLDKTIVYSLSFGEHIGDNEETKKELENILAKQFAEDMSYYLLGKELCDVNNYNEKCVEDFDKIKSEDVVDFFNKLYKYITFLIYRKDPDKLGRKNNKEGLERAYCKEKDIFLIVDWEIYSFMARSSNNNVLKLLKEDLGAVIPTNLENNFKIIMIAKWGILTPYSIEKIEHGGDKIFLTVKYNIYISKRTPAVAFRVKNA